MPHTIQAVYENGMFRPLEPPGLEEHQHVSLLVMPEDPTTVAASQRQALADLTGIGQSGCCDISVSHDSYLYRKD